MDDELQFYLSGPLAFGENDFSFEEADAIVYGVPLDVTTSFNPGTRFGPNAIREASIEMELNIGGAKAHDIGNLAVYPADIAKTLENVESVSRRLLELGKMPIVLGGEHTITYGAAKAFGKDTLLVQFDAHADMRDEYLGAKLSHATVARRILDFLPAENLVQVGVRSTCQEELDFIKKKGVRSITGEEVRRGFGKVVDELAEKGSGRDIYLSIDIDVLDLKCAPATGTPEPGGLGYNELIDLIGALDGRLVGFDITEVCRDENYITAATAAKIIYTLLEGKLLTL